MDFDRPNRPTKAESVSWAEAVRLLKSRTDPVPEYVRIIAEQNRAIREARR
jgi:hypothetical protein